MWYPLHLLYGRLWPTPPMYAWPGIPACWNALTSRPPPCGFHCLRRERSFTLERSPGNALTVTMVPILPGLVIQRTYLSWCGFRTSELVGTTRGGSVVWLWNDMLASL